MLHQRPRSSVWIRKEVEVGLRISHSRDNPGPVAWALTVS